MPFKPFEKSSKDKDRGGKEGSKADQKRDKGERKADDKPESGRMAKKRGKAC